MANLILKKALTNIAAPTRAGSSLFSRSFRSASCVVNRPSFSLQQSQTVNKVAIRPFSNDAASKLLQVVQREFSHEKSSYEPPSNTEDFLKKGDWKFEQVTGDINMTLTKQIDGKKVVVEFQLVSPFQADEAEGGSGQGESEAPENQAEMTDFTVSISNPDGRGMTFFCTTLQNDENYRYMIGNVRHFTSESDKTTVTKYNGPEFEDLDDKLQETLDAWLESNGVTSELCDFIDAMAIDKEQKEYMHWLDNCTKVLQSS